MPILSQPIALHSGFIQTWRQDDAAIRSELSAGLLVPHAFTSSKYLYDALGSKLFAAICDLPEYYPTRTEAAIFDACLADMAASIGHGTTLIDLGAGNCAKAARLFPFLQPRQYVPVDISIDFLRDSVELLRRHFPQIDMLGVGLDFSTALDLPPAVRRDKRLFFYPGSSIGNFTPQQALAFLRRIRAVCSEQPSEAGGLLVGIDLVKDKNILDAAYDDALGVTAAFNLNVLRHLNLLLGSDFDARDWQHRGFFNAEQSRIEMHLEAKRNLVVTWSDGKRRFEKGESIHTENSYKYSREGFLRLLEQAGFKTAGVWSDAQDWFMVCHARVV